MKIARLLRTLAFVLGIVVGFPVNAADLYKAIIPYTPLTGATTPFWIAVEARIFQKYGLEVAPLFVSAGSSVIVPALVSRQFDIGLASGPAVVLNRLGGGDLITIGAQTGVYTTDCFAKPEIKSVNDLKGKTVGVTRFGTSTHFAALSMLKSAGLRPTEVLFVQIGGSAEAIAALTSGRLDAAMLGYPASEVALKKGFIQLSHLAKTENGAFPTTAIVVKESWLKEGKNREIAINFLRAFTEGLVLAKSDAAISKKVLRKYTRVEDDGILLSTFEYYRQFFGDTLKINEQSYANLLQLVDHPRAKGADPKQFFDNSLINQMAK